MCLAPTFKNNFQNTKKKKKNVWETISIFEILKKNLQKVMCRICKLLFCMDNDKVIELIMYFFYLYFFYNDKFQI